VVARILELPQGIAEVTKTLPKTMMERRLQRSEEARPKAIRGEEKPGIELPKKTAKLRKETSREEHVTLDKFVKE